MYTTNNLQLRMGIQNLIANVTSIINNIKPYISIQKKTKLLKNFEKPKMKIELMVIKMRMRSI